MTLISLYGVDFDLPFPPRTDLRPRPPRRAEPAVEVREGPVERRGERVWVAAKPPFVECWYDGEAATLHWEPGSFRITDHEVRIDAADPARAFELYHNPIVSLVVAARGGVAFHGFAAATPTGVVAVMGASGHGKSSLGRALLDRDARLIADDMIVFDGDGRLWPGPRFVRTMTSDRPRRDPGGKLRLAVDAVGDDEAVDLDVVIVLGRRFGVPDELAPTAAIDALLSQIYNPAMPHPGQRRRNLARAADVLQRGRVFGFPRHHRPPATLACIVECLLGGGDIPHHARSAAEEKTMTSAPSTPKPSPEVLVTELPDGESVLLDLKTEHYFGLNELGTAVWELLVEGGDIETLVASTTSATGVDADTVRADISELLGELRTRGLVVDE